MVSALSPALKKVSLVFHAAPREAEAKAEKYGRRELVRERGPLVSKRMDIPSLLAFWATGAYFSLRALGSGREERETIMFSTPETAAISTYCISVFTLASSLSSGTG